MALTIADLSEPVYFADSRRLEVSPTLNPKRRSKLGQFMTPAKIAGFMAQMFETIPRDVRLLDPGAGMGALTAAFVSEACQRKEPPASIDVTAYEVDEELATILRSTLDACEATCERAGVSFSCRIISDDYILEAAEPLLSERRRFNCVIMNPPYGKINVGSQWRKALRSVGIETVNLYSAFVAVALHQLEDEGELVAITPRSFCNGSYYEPFRRFILKSSAILAIHVFESRKTAFKDDDVLQENVVYHLRKDCEQSNVKLLTDALPARDVQFSEVVRPTDPHAFIRLPLVDDDLAAKVQALPCTLSDLGIKVSTGRVVDFRARDHLRKMPGADTVKLIYPAHFDNGNIRWPLSEFKKYNGLADNDHTQKLIVPAGIYVLTKRFSAKEEKRRLVAAVYEGDRAGFENHLNYFHRNGEGLPLKFARGLAAFLNSSAVDQYFRIFSGHTQVNATDLRNLHYPTWEQIEEIGKSNKNAEKAVAALL